MGKYRTNSSKPDGAVLCNGDHIELGSEDCLWLLEGLCVWRINDLIMTNVGVFAMTSDLVLYRDIQEVVEVAQAKDADTKRQAFRVEPTAFRFESFNHRVAGTGRMRPEHSIHLIRSSQFRHQAACDD
jgi:hypothetical protein